MHANLMRWFRCSMSRTITVDRFYDLAHDFTNKADGEHNRADCGPDVPPLICCQFPETSSSPWIPSAAPYWTMPATHWWRFSVESDILLCWVMQMAIAMLVRDEGKKMVWTLEFMAY